MLFEVMENLFHIFSFLKNRELDELYASISLRSFALSLIGVFIPLFLLKTGFTLKQVFLYYIIFNVLRVFFSVIAGMIASRYGFKHLILFSIPFLILFFILLYANPKSILQLFLIALFGSIANSLFWVGYHTDFARFSLPGKRNQEISIANVFILVLKSLGPLIGSLILTFAGFHILFLLSIIIIISSSIPLFFSKEVYEPLNYSLKKLFIDINIKKLLASMSRGVNASVMLVTWPIYVFLHIMNKSYIALGGATSIAFVSTLIATLLIGRISDKKSRFILFISSLGLSFLHLIRLAIKSIVGVFVLNSVFRIVNVSQAISFDSRNYEKAKDRIIETIVLREMNICLGKVIFFSFMYFFSFVAGFIFAAFTTPLISFF